MRAIAVAALLVACGSVHFTDPDAPQLFHSKAEYVTSAVAEPVVWLPVIDVWSEKAEDCDGARAWTLQAIRSAMLAADPRGRELVAADLSPTCVQEPNRSLDLPTLRQEIQAAAAADPTAHVRVVVIYANNIGLPVPGAIIDTLQTVRATGFLWTVARSPVPAQLGPDKSVDWTFTYDAAMQQQIASAAATDLPLQSDSGADSGPRPILGAGDLPRTQEAKLCSASDGITLVRFTADGSASLVNTDLPPLFEIRFPQRYAIPKSRFGLQKAEIEIEGCSANCSGYYTSFPGDLRRWDQTAGCFLKTP